MTTRRISRRQMLESWSLASLTALGVTGMPFYLRRALAAPATAGKKVLFIFLRGGIDAIQAVIPHGDPGNAGIGRKTYAEARPTIGIPAAEAYDLNGFASLNPAMQSNASADSPRVGEIFHGTLDGRAPALAALHRIGYASQNRSHFSSQQFWENGVPGNQGLEVGVFNRYVTRYRDPTSPLQAATINNNQMVLMKGETLIPVLRSIGDFALPANVAIGSLPTPEDVLGSGLRGAYGQRGFDPRHASTGMTYSTGATLLESLQFFEDEVRGTPYAPAVAAQPFYAAIADRRFAGYVQDCARLLKQVDSLRIVGCNQDGYDTHGSEHLRFPALARDLGLAMTALYFDLADIWNDTIVMTMSEFGRTTDENGNRGTDHGESTLMLLMGGTVKGGVYNCDPTTWAPGDLYSTANGRYVAHRTDFRAVYHEIITRHLGDPGGFVDQIIPGYSAAAATDTAGHFAPLGFLS